MDYFSLYESFSNYKADFINNPKFMVSVGIVCVILGILFLVFAVSTDLTERESYPCFYGNRVFSSRNCIYCG